MSRRTLTLAGFSVGLGLAAFLGIARAQQPAPPPMKGVTVTALQAVDLGPEIEGMAGRQLRMRKITIDAGGFFDLHSHKDRPGTVYILEGKLTETRGGVAKEYGPGDTWFENKETSHRLDNKGTAPATFIAVDILKQQ